MIRAKLWLTCAAMHDPVSPVLLAPCRIGWDAKKRQVDLVIERNLKGPELLSRMKGWVTVDVDHLKQVISQHGRLKVLDERELVVEFEDEESFSASKQAISKGFSDQVTLERLG